MSDGKEEKPVSPEDRRLTVKRRLGDAHLLAGGRGAFLGDMTRVAGLEVVELDEKARTDVFEGR